MVKKLLEKYNSIPAAAKCSLWFAICSVIQKGIALNIPEVISNAMELRGFGKNKKRKGIICMFEA